MKRYFLDYNERQIVHAAVRMDSRAGMTSPFSKRAAEAIRKAKDDMDVGDIDPGVRVAIIEKIYQSIAYSQPWEHMGETYCYRGQFYQFRKQFCYLIADYMGLIDARRQERKGADSMAKDWAEWFYQSRAWKDTRAAYIVHAGGYCERCRREVERGKRSLADMKPIKIVHHKIYLTPENINDPTVSLSFDNLEGVCDEHHNREHKAGKGKRYRFDERGQPVPL